MLICQQHNVLHKWKWDGKHKQGGCRLQQQGALVIDIVNTTMIYQLVKLKHH